MQISKNFLPKMNKICCRFQMIWKKSCLIFQKPKWNLCLCLLVISFIVLIIILIIVLVILFTVGGIGYYGHSDREDGVWPRFKKKNFFCFFNFNASFPSKIQKLITKKIQKQAKVCAFVQIQFNELFKFHKIKANFRIEFSNGLFIFQNNHVTRRIFYSKILWEAFIHYAIP